MSWLAVDIYLAASQLSKYPPVATSTIFWPQLLSLFFISHRWWHWKYRFVINVLNCYFTISSWTLSDASTVLWTKRSRFDKKNRWFLYTLSYASSLLLALNSDKWSFNLYESSQESKESIGVGMLTINLPTPTNTSLSTLSIFIDK